MNLFRQIVLTAVAATVFVVPSSAALVTWDFTGTFVSTNYGPHGTSLAGSISFNTATNVATAFSFTVSGYPGDVNYSYTGTPFADVQDDIGYDIISVRGNISKSGPVGLVSSVPWDTAIFTLHDPSQTMLGSAAIPTSAPNLSGIAYKNLILDYDQGYRSDTYTLTSLTQHAEAPEPASMGLIALGLGGLAFLRRPRA